MVVSDQAVEDLENNNKKGAYILKLSLLATGISGIVAEYILATLASYFLPDSTVQWTLIISTMLFFMGIGSRASKFIRTNLLYNFVLIEFILSLLVSFSAVTVFGLAGKTIYPGILIYAYSISVGFLIGMEIPLVARINAEYEELRLNIASVMSYDYIGSLIGGLFFVFVGIPYLGLTYTPFALGLMNFFVAASIIFILKPHLKKYKTLITLGIVCLIFLISGFVFAEKIILFGEQKRYRDKVIHVEQSRYQKIVITEAKGTNWLFLNGNQQLSTLDEWLYHEPMAHLPALLSKKKENILILGGGDGCLVRELLMYSDVKKITLVDIDPKMIHLAKSHPVLTKMNKKSLLNKKVKTVTDDAFNFIQSSKELYDLIYVDLPDPKTLDINKIYCNEFYSACYNKLNNDGVFITQAGSPYFATKAFYCIDKTLAHAGFSTLPLHNQVMTMGEWGWVMGHKKINTNQMISQLKATNFDNPQFKWLNSQAINLLISFGKPFKDTTDLEINTLINPVLTQYYKKGIWEVY